MSPKALLEQLSGMISQGHWPSRCDMRWIVRLCAHPDGRVREAALVLLLAPVIADELQHHKRLASAIAESGAPMRDIPGPLLQLILEQIAFVGKIPDSRRRPFYGGVVRKLLQTQLQELLWKRIPAGGLVGLLPPGRRLRGTSPGLRRSWRLLVKRLRTQQDGPSWAGVTIADIAGILSARSGSAANRARGCGRFYALGKAIVFPAVKLGTADSCSSRGLPSYTPNVFHRAVPPLHQCHWGGWGKRTLCRFERLIRLQAEELRAVRELALQVSEATGRVVLSWHNASLAAAGGWAFEELRDFFPSEQTWESFCREVGRSALNGCADSRIGMADAGLHFDLREERIVLPKISHALWESRTRAFFDPSHETQWRKDLKVAESFLSPDTIEDIVDGRKLSWHGAVSPHQTIRVTDMAVGRETARAAWIGGLEQLRALVSAGQSLLDSGEIPRLVLPWIDKFFISSKGEEDLGFLPSLTGWLEDCGLEPLILFFEDTSRSITPTFGLALQRLIERGCPYRGIGIFGEGRWERERAREIILDEHGAVRLFALRPFTDMHHQASLKGILFDSEARFPEVYDSSWKDDLGFLYTGTQVWPLLSVQCTPEIFPGWVGAFHRKIPFGAWFRSRLRNLALGRDAAPAADQLSLDYGSWANLY